MRVEAECGVDHAMTWVNGPAYGKHYPLDPELTVWFSHSRFVGYQYGEQGTKLAPRAPSLGTVLATTRRLTVGDKLSRGRQLYGAAFRTSTAQGGVFLIGAPAGRIDGYAWGSPRYGTSASRAWWRRLTRGMWAAPPCRPDGHAKRRRRNSDRSGRPDSNRGPQAPKACALTRLRYAPCVAARV